MEYNKLNMEYDLLEQERQKEIDEDIKRISSMKGLSPEQKSELFSDNIPMFLDELVQHRDDKNILKNYQY